MNDEQRLTQALEACLEQMRSDGRGADAVLRDHPDLADRLRPLLVVASGLRNLEPVPGPSDAFRSRLAADLATAPAPATAPAAAVHGVPVESLTPTESLVRALDSCLTRITSEGADPAVVLAEYPDLAGELRPLIAAAAGIETLGPVESPEPEFRERLARELQRAPLPRSLAEETIRGPSILQRLWRSTAVTAAAAATMVLMIVFGAVYASADARPGSWLYPLKRATEQARLWAVPDGESLWLRLGYADLRLTEALAERAYAGDMLADFSREVTGALAEADEILLAGLPREHFAPAMLEWLFDERTRLVDGRPQLPPTAWRGSLALVDEAIRAMQGGQLAVAPVPRLADPSRSLRTAAPVSRAPGRVVQRRQLGAAAEGTGGSAGGADTIDRVVVVAPNRVGGLDAASNLPGPTDVPPRRVAPPATARPDPKPTARPPQEPTDPAPPATAVLPPTEPTTEPTMGPPTQPPTDPPTDPPTAEPSPGPTNAPVTPTAEPSPVPTNPPVSPTAPVLNKPPVIDQVVCDDRRLLLGKSTMCHVVAYDPEGAELSFLWSSDVPEMLNRTYKDATFFAAWGASGGVMTVRITVHVSDSGDVDPDGDGVTMAETYLEVYPPGAQGR